MGTDSAELKGTTETQENPFLDPAQIFLEKTRKILKLEEQRLEIIDLWTKNNTNTKCDTSWTLTLNGRKATYNKENSKLGKSKIILMKRIVSSKKKKSSQKSIISY